MKSLSNKSTSYRIVLNGFIFSFIIVMSKGLFKTINDKKMGLNFFESEYINNLFSLLKIPIFNFLIIYSAYFILLYLIDKLLNHNNDIELFKDFILRIMAPSLMVLFLHPIFYFIRKATEYELFLIYFDRILMASIMIYTIVIIKLTYKVKAMILIALCLFILFPFIISFSAKILCPYCLWL